MKTYIELDKHNRQQILNEAIADYYEELNCFLETKDWDTMYELTNTIKKLEDYKCIHSSSLSL